MPPAAKHKIPLNHKDVPTRHDGQAIRNLRIQAGMDTRELAARIGLTRKSLWNIEAGYRDTRPEVLSRIAKTLGVDVAAIMRPSRRNGNGPRSAA